MSQIWLISDTHFKHDNIYRFTGDDGLRIRREFSPNSSLEGDEAIIQRWNETVRQEDHVYHLGDFTFDESNLVIWDRLPGHLRWVLGNHDPKYRKGLDKAPRRVEKILGSAKVDNLILTHIPIHNTSIPAWCLGNVHGHIHRQAAPSPQHFNVSVEMIDYRPIAIEEVQAALRKQQPEWAPPPPRKKERF